MHGGLFQMIEDLVTFFRGGNAKHVAPVTVTDALKPVDDGRRAMMDEPTADATNTLPVVQSLHTDAAPSVAAIHLAGELDTVPERDFSAFNAPLVDPGVYVDLSTPATDTDRAAAQALAANAIRNDVLQKFVAQAENNQRILYATTPSGVSARLV